MYNINTSLKKFKRLDNNTFVFTNGEPLDGWKPERMLLVDKKTLLEEAREASTSDCDKAFFNDVLNGRISVNDEKLLDEVEESVFKDWFDIENYINFNYHYFSLLDLKSFEPVNIMVPDFIYKRLGLERDYDAIDLIQDEMEKEKLVLIIKALREQENDV